MPPSPRKQNSATGSSVRLSHADDPSSLRAVSPIGGLDQSISPTPAAWLVSAGGGNGSAQRSIDTVPLQACARHRVGAPDTAHIVE